MKKGQVEAAILYILALIILSAFIPTLLQSVSDMFGINEVKEELNQCKSELSTLRNRVNQLESRNQELESLIGDCESKIQNLTSELSSCSQKLGGCNDELSTANERIESLTNCWEELQYYKEELDTCQQLNKTITPQNLNQYTVVFRYYEIELKYIVFVSFAFPIIGQLISFKFISVEARFRRKKTQQVIFLIKSFTSLVPAGIWISFFLKTPLIPTLLIFVGLGLFISNEFFKSTYKNKIDSIVEFVKIESKYLDEKRKKK